jgi:hypothetical protein
VTGASALLASAVRCASLGVVSMNRSSQSAFVLVLALVLTGCPKRESEVDDYGPGARGLPTPSGLPAPVATGLPGDPAQVSKVVNPKGLKAFDGSTATVRGVVRATGDASIDRPEIVAKIGDDCAEAKAFYAPALREGPGRTLADVLVTVTGYDGYVPPAAEKVKLEAQGCSYGTRTIALTFGQKLEVFSKDKRSYVPDLVGQKMDSQLVATPFGRGAAEVYPKEPGGYVLIDNLRLYSAAELLVLKYSTHQVTGLDGRFEIGRIPAGPVTVTAFLPATGATVQKKVDLKGGESLDLEFALPFDAAAYQKQREATVAQAGKPSSASAAPSAAPAAPSASAAH